VKGTNAGLAAIALGLFVLYLVTRSFVHGWDALAYTARAHDHALLGERYLSLHLLHPQHLAYMPLARAFTSVLARVAPDPFLPLQVFSALSAALSALVFGLAVARRVGPARAAFVAAGVGLAYGTWRYGSDVEVMAPALAALAFAVLALAEGREPHWTRAGVALGVATTLHNSQTEKPMCSAKIDHARLRQAMRLPSRSQNCGSSGAQCSIQVRRRTFMCCSRKQRSVRARCKRFLATRRSRQGPDPRDLPPSRSSDVRGRCARCRMSATTSGPIFGCSGITRGATPYASTTARHVGPITAVTT